MRKHLEDDPVAVPVPNELSEFELCTVVLALQTKHVLVAHNASHGTKFAVCLDSLTRLLKKAYNSVKSNRMLLD